MEDLEIFREIVRLKEAREPAALATIVESRGSVPRQAGTRMLVRADGSTLGTLGGGPVEAEVIRQAREMPPGGEPRTLPFSLTAEQGLVCGGELTVFLESLAVIPRLVVVGEGHVGRAVARAASMAGFAVETVRPEEGEPLPAVDAATYILVASRDHHLDFAAVREALDTEACFIGLLGSRRKRKALGEHLRAEGLPASALERVTTPVGLSIGARTPGEIALSIAAQLVQTRRERASQRLSAAPGRRPLPADGEPQAAFAPGG